MGGKGGEEMTGLRGGDSVRRPLTMSFDWQLKMASAIAAKFPAAPAVLIESASAYVSPLAGGINARGAGAARDAKS